MRILYLNTDPGIPVLGNKGASVHVREFVASAVRQGHEVAIACAALGEGNALPTARLIELRAEAELAALQRECIERQLIWEKIEDPVLRRELRWLAHDRDFARRTLAALDMVHFCPDVIYERHALFHCSGVALAKRLEVPRLLEVNAPLVEEQERHRGLALKPLALAMERISYNGADRVVAVSAEVASHVAAAGVPRERVMLVPNGVDTSRFRPGIPDRRIFGEGPVLGFIGSFKPWHGMDFLIRSFAEMARRHPTIRLVCIGEGPMLEKIRADISEHGVAGRVALAGRVPHDAVPELLGAMDATVAPYLPQQDFYFSPLKVVESLSAGVPVIAARIGQLESLIDDGVTGLLFTPGDQAEFVDKTLDLLARPEVCKAMGKAARHRAVAEFGWDAAVGRIIASAGELIQTRAAA